MNHSVTAVLSSGQSERRFLTLAVYRCALYWLAFVVIVCCLTWSAKAQGNDWPGFRGLGLSGVVSDGEIPTSWDQDDYRWSFDLKTRDVGSMAVIGNRVYVLASGEDGESVRLVSVDLESGEENWTKRFPNASNHLHSRNTLASSTPAVDADHVYVAHSDRKHTWLRCLDHAGNEVWARDFGVAQSQHGFGTSPAVHGDIVLFNFSQQKDRVESGQPGTSHVIALDRNSGETIWSVPVTSTRVCYGVPAVDDGKVYCANTGDGLYALSLQTGELLWRKPVFRMRCVSSPIVSGDLVIGSSGSGGGGNHLVAVRMPKSAGEQPQEAYRIERAAPYVPTAVIRDGLMFIVDDRGIASCVEVATGKLHWSKRIGGKFEASPIIVGDRCLLISMDGEATVIRAAAEFEELGTIDLEGPVGATPVYAHDRLILRVGTKLVCL
jgi:outer membrane protein assembly factor BamB